MSGGDARVARWYAAGRLAEMAVGSSRLLETDDGHPVAVWRLTDGRVFATDDQCSHYFWSLHGSGTLNGTEVTCLGHDARFDVTTGAALCPPARLPLATYDVVVDDKGQVLVRA